MSKTISSSLKLRLQQYGPWAIVTGASSGIGKELAARLAEAGLNIVAVGRNETALEELSEALEHNYRVDVRTLIADLSTKTGVQQVIQQSRELDIGLYVASAGFGTSGPFHEAVITEEVNMIEVNCTALMILTHHYTTLFQQRKKGGIILLSSMVGFQGVPYAAHYAATKAYVQSLGEALSVELKPLGIDVLAAAPGPVHSGFASRANMKLGNAMSPTDIGISILKSLGRKGTVLPGLQTKFLVSALRTVPRWGKVRIMKMVMGSMTSHQ